LAFGIFTGSEMLFTLTIPATVKVTAVLVATAHEAPTRVTVRICAPGDTTVGVAPVAVQPVKPDTSAIVVGLGIVRTKLEGKATTNVLAFVSAPPAVSVVTPTVQVEVCWLTVEPGEKVTAERPMTIADDGLVGVTSFDVATLNPDAGLDAAKAGFVTAGIVNVTAVLAPTVQVAGKVIKSTCDAKVVTAEVQAPPVPVLKVGDAVDALNPDGSVTEIVSAATSATLLVNPTVHTDVALVSVDAGLKVTADGAVAALAMVAVPRSTIAMTMAPAVNLLMR
jgi:hypothetical protein